MIENTVRLGLYRHFKGSYYFLMNVMRSDDGIYAQYVNVLHPEYGFFCRPYVEWSDTVIDRKDNVTGQIHRFEPVLSIEDGVKNLSTDQLVRELNGRKDNPFLIYDIPKLNSKVCFRDWCLGEIVLPSKESSGGIVTQETFDSLEQAQAYINKHVKSKRVGLFKRVFIEENSDEMEF